MALSSGAMDNFVNTSTIAAIATAQGAAGVAIVRLSGPRALAIACKLSGKSDLQPRQAVYARALASDGSLIDQGVMIYFKAPNSFTGEEVVEFQGHGGVQLPRLVLARCFELGAVQAGPGEFSARAYLNNKMDLLQAESIADAIHASSEAAARGAVRSLSGEFSSRVDALLADLIHLRLYIESSIDFPDEEGVEFLGDQQLSELLGKVEVDLESLERAAKQGQLLRDGANLVIAGLPNAGKSSLLNALAGVDRAIVTSEAGTTRDVLTEHLLIDGLALNVTDTAGLRDTENLAEQIGIERARAAIQAADLLLVVFDVTQISDPYAHAQALLKTDTETQIDPSRLLLVANKVDLLETNPRDQDQNLLSISAKHGAGLDKLKNAIHERIGFDPQPDALIARTRHLDALLRVSGFVAEARTQLSVYGSGELAAESLRLAQEALSEITGEFTSDDLLGEIFGSFCIGK